MDASKPWFNPKLYVTFDQWNAQPWQCIAPTLYENNRRCRCEPSNLDEAQFLKRKAASLPFGRERDKAIENMILDLCCIFASHRTKLQANTYAVLTHLVRDYGERLGWTDVFTTDKCAVPDTVRVQHETAVPTAWSAPQPAAVFVPFQVRDEKETVTVGAEIVKDVDVKYARDGQVYCAMWPASPNFLKIGYSAASASTRIATQEQCFAGLTPEAFFRFAFPQKIERLVHRELHSRRHEIVVCTSCESSHIEWFKVASTDAVQILSDWYRLSQKDPLYDVDGKLRPVWKARISDLPGDITASRLLEIIEPKKSTAIGLTDQPTIKTEQTLDSSQLVTESVATELLKEMSNLRDELKLARNFESSKNLIKAEVKSENDHQFVPMFKPSMKPLIKHETESGIKPEARAWSDTTPTETVTASSEARYPIRPAIDLLNTPMTIPSQYTISSTTPPPPPSVSHTSQALSNPLYSFNSLLPSKPAADLRFPPFGWRESAQGVAQVSTQPPPMWAPAPAAANSFGFGLPPTPPSTTAKPNQYQPTRAAPSLNGDFSFSNSSKYTTPATPCPALRPPSNSTTENPPTLVSRLPSAFFRGSDTEQPRPEPSIKTAASIFENSDFMSKSSDSLLKNVEPVRNFPTFSFNININTPQIRDTKLPDSFRFTWPDGTSGNSVFPHFDPKRTTKPLNSQQSDMPISSAPISTISTPQSEGSLSWSSTITPTHTPLKASYTNSITTPVKQPRHKFEASPSNAVNQSLNNVSGQAKSIIRFEKSSAKTQRATLTNQDVVALGSDCPEEHNVSTQPNTKQTTSRDDATGQGCDKDVPDSLIKQETSSHENKVLSNESQVNRQPRTGEDTEQPSSANIDDSTSSVDSGAAAGQDRRCRKDAVTTCCCEDAPAGSVVDKSSLDDTTLKSFSDIIMPMACLNSIASVPDQGLNTLPLAAAAAAAGAAVAVVNAASTEGADEITFQA